MIIATYTIDGVPGILRFSSISTAAQHMTEMIEFYRSRMTMGIFRRTR